MIRAALVAVAIAAAMPAPAQASEISGGSSLLRVRVHRLLERSKMPDVSGLQVVLGPCPDSTVNAFGCTFPATRSPVWVEPSVVMGGFELFHEIGHRVKFDELSAAASSRFLAIMHYGSWDADTDELFADAYSSCALGWRPHPSRDPDHVDELFPTANGYEPTPSQQRRVCSLIVSDAFTPS